MSVWNGSRSQVRNANADSLMPTRMPPAKSEEVTMRAAP